MLAGNSYGAAGSRPLHSLAMGALVTLSAKTVEVQPGSVATCVVTVKNTGTVVDQFTIDILGDPAGFAAAEPATLSLFPGAEGTATVFFRPPRAAETPTGELPFGVRDGFSSVWEAGRWADSTLDFLAHAPVRA